MLKKISILVFSFCMTLACYALAQGNTMELLSPAFKHNDSIPKKYSCQGENISPPLQWKNSPAKTISFVLIMDDPDAPNGAWDHWILFNIPKNKLELPENITTLSDGISYGKNSWGNLSYGGPCPPNGEHRYYFKLYALDVLLDLPSGVDKETLENAMKGHVVASAELMGRYKK